MKKSELKQMIREEAKKMLKEGMEEKDAIKAMTKYFSLLGDEGYKDSKNSEKAMDQNIMEDVADTIVDSIKEAFKLSDISVPESKKIQTFMKKFL